MSTVVIIQARMGSTRLPGKVLKKVLGKTLLEYQLERVQRCRYIDNIVVATTTKEADQAIVDLCNTIQIPVFRGSEEDVLGRYYEASLQYNADVIVRLTSDCPIIDPIIIDQVIQEYIANKGRYDYVSNTLLRTFPRGMDTEVFSFKVLEDCYYRANDHAHREHVTNFIYSNPKLYSLGHVKWKEDLSAYRWTVDTPEDFALIKAIIEYMYPRNRNFTLQETIEAMKLYPEWSLINAHVEQKMV